MASQNAPRRQRSIQKQVPARIGPSQNGDQGAMQAGARVIRPRLSQTASAEARIRGDAPPAAALRCTFLPWFEKTGG